MERTPLPPPPEKSGSFAGRNANNKTEPDSSSSTVEQQNENSEGRDVNVELDDSSTDDLHLHLHLCSLPQVSEEIDRFQSHLSTVDDKSNPPDIPNSVEAYSKLVESLIAKYDSGDFPTKFGQIPEEDASLIEAVNRISKLTNALGEFHSASTTTASSLNRTSTVLQRAMSFLEEEFQNLLECSRSISNSDHHDPNNKVLKTKQSSFNNNCNQLDSADRCALPESDQNTGEDGDFSAYSAEVISNMNRIATAMISAGYETECCQVYSVMRRNAFKEAMNKLGFDNISINDVQKMQWEPLEGEIATWIKVVKKCSTVLFSSERKLCESVFSDYPSISQSLFSNLARAVVIQLLNFAEAVAMTKRSAEKLFKFLDMYETLRDLTPVIDGTSDSDEFAHELKSETSAAGNRLGEAAGSIFCDLENSIKSDTGKTPVPSGAVHPLTRYTMNYLKYACEYKETLQQIFQQHQMKLDRSDSSAGSDSEQSETTNNQNNNNQTQDSPFSLQLMAVMELLDANLEAKSMLYKDPSLRYIFLMNNGRYIMQKIKGSGEIHELMGDTWSRKRSSDLRQYHKNYQRETWSKVLGCLYHEGLRVNGKVSKPVLKERFKSFNAMFEEIHKTQSAWVVSDEQLQSELRVSISAVVTPAYRSFLGRFRQYLDAGRQAEKYIKYQPEDIETSIDELFDGNPASMARRRT